MKEQLKASALKFKNHVARNRWTYAWATVAVSAFAALQVNRVQIDKFLEEKGIDPKEFWLPEEAATS